MAAQNSPFDSTTLDVASAPEQNVFPQSQQVDPNTYLKLIDQLQQAQRAKRAQQQALDGNQIHFQTEQDRQNFFQDRDMQNQRIDFLANQVAAIPKPTAEQLHPVDLSQTPLTADPTSQFARLQKVGALAQFAGLNQARQYQNWSDNQLQNKIDLQSGRTPTAPQVSPIFQPVTGEQLIQSPTFQSLMQTDRARGDQIFQAATGQTFDMFQQHAMAQRELLAKSGADLILEKSKSNDFLFDPRTGNFVMAQEDPLSKQKVYFSPTGDDKNSGINPRIPKKMAAFTAQISMLGIKKLGMDKVASLQNQGQSDIEQTPDTMVSKILNWVAADNGKGATPTPKSSYWSIPDSPYSEVNPDANIRVAGATAPILAQDHFITQGLANTGKTAVGWAQGATNIAGRNSTLGMAYDLANLLAKPQTDPSQPLIPAKGRMPIKHR